MWLRRGVLLGCLLMIGGGVASAQQSAEEARELGWSNATDLSYVQTDGNSAARTLGFANRLRYVWPDARFQFDMTSVRSDTSDDRFYQVDPGFVFPVGTTPDDLTFQLVAPSPSPDVANYLAGGKYDKNISEQFFWNAGASWDRNEDAGLLHRYIAFAGVGNTWSDTEDRQFSTSYGLSVTDREEEASDPEKDRRFGGARLGVDYLERLSAMTVFESDFTTNVNVANVSDYSFNTTNSVTVSMSENLSLKVSLQLLYENEPALETGLDVVAHAELLDPDGIPGSGDELFETVASGGAMLVLGSADARKGSLDTVFRTALVITF
ncbi:MAG: DUF481 domain-containing protein [Dehalococcoidia bacterium]|jgi:hypothetical protein|nr:DUF481 domain-containing protein [Dehalococcoidia bacterium]